MRFSMRVGALLAAAMMLAGCPGPGGSGRGVTPAGQMRTLFGGPNCELKNPTGSGTCEDGSTLIGRVDDSSSEPQSGTSTYTPVSTPEPVSAPGPELGTDSDSGSATGGCVWKNRSYQPGDKIRSVNDGTILSEDLFINGQNFGDLSGQSGPWQGCDCSSTSSHWGCV